MSGPAVRRTRCPQHARQAWESQAAATAGGPAWHLASACGNVAPARNTGLGCAQRPLGTWPAWDMPGPGALGTRGAGKAAAGHRLSRAPPLQRRRPRLHVAPRPLLVAPGHPSTGKTSRRRQHQQRKKAACRTRVTRGGPAWTARRPRRPFSALQTSPEPLDPLRGSGGGGSGRLVPHPRLAQLPGVWAAAHCSRCPRRHRSRGSPSASHVPDRCA